MPPPRPKLPPARCVAWRPSLPPLQSSSLQSADSAVLAPSAAAVNERTSPPRRHRAPASCLPFPDRPTAASDRATAHKRTRRRWRARIRPPRRSCNSDSDEEKKREGKEEKRSCLNLLRRTTRAQQDGLASPLPHSLTPCPSSDRVSDASSLPLKCRCFHHHQNKFRRV